MLRGHLPLKGQALIMETDITKHALVGLTVEPAKHTKTVVQSHKDNSFATVGLRTLDEPSRIVLLLILVPKDIATTMDPDNNRSFLDQCNSSH